MTFFYAFYAFFMRLGLRFDGVQTGSYPKRRGNYLSACSASTSKAFLYASPFEIQAEKAAME